MQKQTSRRCNRCRASQVCKQQFEGPRRFVCNKNVRAQCEVLTELIDAAGGWQAAVVIGQGLVNTAAKLEYWLVEEQNHILKTMKEFLGEEAENVLDINGIGTVDDVTVDDVTVADFTVVEAI